MDHSSLTRELYIEELKQRHQFDVVSSKTGTSTRASILTWTQRNTGCDVISLVTTTKPLSHGEMKDIRIKFEEIHTVRPLKSNTGQSVYAKPLNPETNSAVMERNAMNTLLRDERDKFFRRLKAARQARSTFESVAAIVIQSLVRGHLTRLNLDKILFINDMIKQYRARIRKALNESAIKPLPVLSKYRANYFSLRIKAVMKIQMLFRRFLSTRLLKRKQEEKRQRVISNKILKLQCAGRKYNAKKRVNIVKERKQLNARQIASIKLQVIIRCYLAKRRVAKRRYIFHYLAAKIIQCFYRSILGRRYVGSKRSALIMRRRQRGAIALQQVARNYIARLRVNRISARKTYFRFFNAATSIEKIVRAFISRSRVRRLLKSREGERTKARELARKEAANKDAEEASTLLEEVDLFLQAKKGNATAVEDVFLGHVTDEKHDINEIDSNGDTILLIAAIHSHMDIVRKCIIWGFDINFRNESTGMSVISAAAYHKQFNVVQYLLNAPTPEPSPHNLRPTKQVIEWSPSDAAIVLTSIAAYSNNVGLMTTVMDLLGPGALSYGHLETGETALHAACKGGVLDMVKLVAKSCKPEAFQTKDDSGRTPYHAASESSSEIIKYLVEIDPNINSADTLNKDAAIVDILSEPDGNSKSCLLTAAIHGNDDILSYFYSLNSGLGDEARVVQHGDIGWTPLDIDSALSTTGKGKLECLSFMFDAGFDPSWGNDESGTTIVMESCRRGVKDVLNFFLKHNVDMMQADLSGLTAVHYCAMCTSDNMISYVLSHGCAAACKVSSMSLTASDNKGRTPIHIAAEFGADLSFDLLAQDGINAAINARTTIEKLTPIMIAAKFYKIDTLNRLLVLDADAKLLDASGRSVLWHLLQGSLIAGGNLQATTRMAVSSAGLELVRAGCSVVSLNARTVEDYRNLKEDYVKNKINKDKLEVIELIAIDKNTTFIRSIAKLVSPEICWRIALTCILFDDDDGILYNALITGGGEAVMMGLPNDGVNDTGNKLINKSYNGFTLLVWTLILNNITLFKKLFDKQGKCSVDSEGNTILHIAARYCSRDTVSFIMSNKSVLVEAVNHAGRTALMEGMKFGSFCKNSSLLYLAKKVADPRRGLEVRFDAWLLATCRMRERREKNLMNGKIQDDDDNILPMKPDANYLFWYNALAYSPRNK